MTDIEKILERWSERRTVRRFREEPEFDLTEQEVAALDKAITFTPAQTDNSGVWHTWIRLNKQDHELKLFLSKYWYLDSKHNPNIHMIQVLTAPIVYLCFHRWYMPASDQHSDKIKGFDLEKATLREQNHVYRHSSATNFNIGIDLGSLLMTANYLGLDSACIGCTSYDSFEKYRLEWETLLYKRFSKEDISATKPIVAFTVGHEYSMSKGTGIQYYIPSSNVEALENNDVLPYLTNYHHTKHDRSLFKLLT